MRSALPVATVERYNGLAAEGCDTDQGKAPWRLSAVDEPPYYAAKMAGWLLCTTGGVRVGYDHRAVDEAASPSRASTWPATIAAASSPATTPKIGPRRARLAFSVVIGHGFFSQPILDR